MNLESRSAAKGVPGIGAHWKGKAGQNRQTYPLSSYKDNLRFGTALKFAGTEAAAGTVRAEMVFADETLFSQKPTRGRGKLNPTPPCQRAKTVNRVFLLSPARVGGKRAAMLMRPAATFELARQVQIEAAELGAIFAFCSGLYFRGKLAYARRFARPPAGIAGVQVITPSRGLVDADTLLGLRALTEFIEVPIDSTEPRFVEPLRQSAAALAGQASLEVVLLGSIATGKYSDTLLPVFGERLLCPSEFSGRGDMSRGALLLRSVAAGQELAYAPVAPVVPASRRKSPKTGPDAPSRGG